MKVYHGSNYIVKEIDLNILNYKTDFGKGFYTTTDYDQAMRWTIIKKDRQLKENKNDIHQYINVYEYVEKSGLKILDFDKANEEWLNFIIKNRQSGSLLHDYDIVKGPVANDNLYRVLVAYENGDYDIMETIKRLKTYTLSNQISFHTEKSLSCLKYLETIEVGDVNNE